MADRKATDHRGEMRRARASPRSLAIACASGGFKGAFIHGVLSAFEAAGLRADVYAASSASVASTAFAAAGVARDIGVEYWVRARRVLDRPGAGMSEVLLQCIIDYAPLVRAVLFRAGMPRLVVVASAVITPEAVTQTQGDAARALGRRLLVGAARRDRTWADTHLARQLFDRASRGTEDRLTEENFDAVAYASTRMLHAWTVPAWVEGRAYIDASYTCACAACELADEGYSEVIAVAAEPGPVYRDLFRSGDIPERRRGVPIHLVRPDVDPSHMGVDYAQGTEAGLAELYRQGEKQGRTFLAAWDANHRAE